MASKRKRTKRSGLAVGDRVLARGGDDWRPGTVSRSLFRGTEVDVRCDDGTMLRNLTSKDVRGSVADDVKAAPMPSWEEQARAIVGKPSYIDMRKVLRVIVKQTSG